MKIIHNEFRIIAMQRTGHHAIEDWIYAGFNHPKFKITHCNFRDGTRIPSKSKKNSYRNLNKIFDENEFFNLLIYDFQQVNLDEMHDGNLRERDGYQIWPAANKFLVERSLIILIIRNPYNWVASYLQKWRFLKNPALNRYKKHLKQAIGIKNYFGDYSDNFVVFYYDKWFSDENYRKKMINLLGMNCGSEQYQEVPVMGGGSGFDELKHQGNAGKMKVLERYKVYLKDWQFKKIFQDKELIELAEKAGFTKPKEVQ
jgi:hypothetical protein